MTGSTTSFLAAATACPPVIIEPSGPKLSRPGSRLQVLPAWHERQCAQPALPALARPMSYKLTIPRHAQPAAIKSPITVQVDDAHRYNQVSGSLTNQMAIPRVRTACPVQKLSTLKRLSSPFASGKTSSTCITGPLLDQVTCRRRIP